MPFCKCFPYPRSRSSDEPQKSTVTVYLSLFIPVNYLTVVSAAAIAAGFHFVLVGFHLLARKRSLLAPLSSKIGSAAPGLVEVNGMVAGLHTITAPISGDLCFLYRATAWQQDESMKQKWKKVAEENLYLPFLINDSTGELLIEPPGADLDLLRNFREEYEASSFSPNVVPLDGNKNQDKDKNKNERASNQEEKNADDVPPRVRAFLSRHGIVPTRRVRVEEYSIKPQDALFIAGTLVEIPGTGNSSKVSTGVSNRDPRNTDLPNDPLRDAPPHSPAEPLPVPQVVRLAFGAAASTSSHMTQQGKINAALTRAGMAAPEVWSAAEAPSQNAEARVGSDALVRPAFPHEESRPQLSEPAQFAEGSRVPQHLIEQLDLPVPELVPENGARPNQGPPNDVRLHEIRVREACSTEDAAFPMFDFTAPVALRKGANGPTFVISYRSQKEFVSTLAWKSVAALSGGAALTGLGLCALLAKMLA
jgi:hypothetical protein